MKTKRNLIITIIFSVLAIIGLAIATSYALFSIDITKNKNFKLAVGNLELSIDDQGNNITDGKIVVNNMVPVRDSVGMAQDGFVFTLSNTGTIDANYSIYLDDVVLSSLPTGTDGRLDNSLVRVNLTNLTTNISHTYTLSEISNRLLENGTLNVGASNSYVLRMWLDYYAGNEAQNKYYATRIRVDSVQKNSTLPAGIYDSSDNLLASWDSLVNTYHLDLTKDYVFNEDFVFNGPSLLYSNSSMLGYILENNPSLANGTKLVIGNVNRIGDNTLSYLFNFQSVIIPDSVTSIGENAFSFLKNVDEIEIPSSVTTIENKAFNINRLIIYNGNALDSENNNWGALSRVRSIIKYNEDNPTPGLYGKSGTLIYNWQELEEKGITKAAIEKDYNEPVLQENAEDIFNPMNANITYETYGTLVLPNKITRIGNYALSYYYFHSIVLPSSITEIGIGSFKNNSVLTNVILKENSNLSIIGVDAFADTKWFDTESAKGKVYLNGVEVTSTNGS